MARVASFQFSFSLFLTRSPSDMALFVLFLCVSLAAGQLGSVGGSVRVAGSGEALPGAVVAARGAGCPVARR